MKLPSRTGYIESVSGQLQLRARKLHTPREDDQECAVSIKAMRRFQVCARIAEQAEGYAKATENLSYGGTNHPPAQTTAVRGQVTEYRPKDIPNETNETNNIPNCNPDTQKQ
ncbi:hypothetical protein G7K_0222-t1 [Saitoella complicata NRRL Y-17804]|uniref:Uncharacterized protein n=1 Tax=Saitoella complicata (strain BCRC 22490 / CBS 7301 / JCM 7358 / NBRC 10748 / NRRL Y-17804) TaxID=698492 RepID=A0A0E9N7T4_SAICN|nr:hypothetical protein G7K_0222-t1 [Saitoella complicata NRRL Y-17804]